MRLVYSFIVSLALGLTVAASHAAYMPPGVQTNVAVSTVIDDWGWTQCSAFAGDSFSPTLAEIQTQCGEGYLMLAVIRDGTTTFDILAAAPRSDVLFDTGIQRSSPDISHLANGVQWYYSPEWSWGFAAIGNPVELDSCDLNLIGWQRIYNVGMCWHTDSASVRGGFAYNTTGTSAGFAYIDGDVQRVVLQASEITNQAPVSVPGTMALLGLGMAALGWTARRRS